MLNLVLALLQALLILGFCQAPTDAVNRLLRLIRAIQTVRNFAVRQARVFFQ